MIVVSDSTILIGLAKIGKLELLREIFSEVYIPEDDIFCGPSVVFTKQK